MGGILFALAFFVAAGVVVARFARRRLIEAREDDHVVIKSYDDIAPLVRRLQCSCGRRFELVGEGPGSDDDDGAIQLECVCGRQRRLHFTLAN